MTKARNAAAREFCTQAVWGHAMTPVHLTIPHDPAASNAKMVVAGAPFEQQQLRSLIERICDYLQRCEISYSAGTDDYLKEQLDPLLSHFPDARAMWKFLHVSCGALVVVTASICSSGEEWKRIPEIRGFSGPGQHIPERRREAIIDAYRNLYKRVTSEAWVRMFAE